MVFSSFFPFPSFVGGMWNYCPHCLGESPADSSPSSSFRSLSQMFCCGVQLPVSISLLFGIKCLCCFFGPFYPGKGVISASLFSGVIWKHPCSPGSSLVSSMMWWCWLGAVPSLVPRHEMREHTTKGSWVKIRNGRDKEWGR